MHRGIPASHRRHLPIVASLGTLVVVATCAGEPVLPPGFQAQRVITRLDQPVALSFAADGRAFVAEKGGRVLSFPTLPAVGEAARTPGTAGVTVFRDLSTEVQDFWDRGLLGLAVAPSFPIDRRVYVLYTRDSVGGTPGRWGDGCPDPPGATRDGCTVTQRLSVLTAGASDGVAAAGENVLIEGWCSQYPTHSVGNLGFGNDGQLYASAGDGAGFESPDTGNGGGSPGSPTPANPCGDGHPGDVVGARQTGPGAEGGALRAQDIRTPGDPTTLSGTIVRLDPNTGAGSADNPFSASPDANARRIVGYGLRNPFRFTFRPGRSEVWLGDVGWSSWEEVNILPDPVRAAPNFGWPCEEGPFRQPAYDLADVSLCEGLYADGSAARPYFTYAHGGDVAPGDEPGPGRPGICPAPGAGGDSVTAIGFAPTTGTRYPPGYRGALVFGDYSRRCVWLAPIGANGLPDNTAIQRFIVDVAPAQIVAGPGGDLYYIDVVAGEVRRVRYVGPGNPPQATLTASRRVGPAPLAVTFDASGSTDVDPGPLTYEWDLDGDGVFTDATGATAARSYPTGDFDVSVRVTDASGLSDVAGVTIVSGDDPPAPVISAPSAALRWRAGQRITATGFATDVQQGSIPQDGLKWNLDLYHCERADPRACHYHRLESVQGDRFSFTAPDHEYPARLILQLTAKDARRVEESAYVTIEPETAQVTYDTKPSGGRMSLGGRAVTGPVTRTEIVGSTVGLSVPPDQELRGVNRPFARWSDGETAARREVTIPPGGATYVATHVNHRPLVRVRWSPHAGTAPLDVRFDARRSRDTDRGDRLTYAWDLDADGRFDDGAAATATFRYAKPARIRPRVRVTDTAGAIGDLRLEVAALPAGAVVGAVRRRCRWRATYFAGEDLSGHPIARHCTPSVRYDWGRRAPFGGAPRDHFSARYQGGYDVPGGLVTFEASADDGLRLFVDDRLLIDRWEEGAYSPIRIVTRVRKGRHRVRVEYVERADAARVGVSWSRTPPRAP